MEYEQQRTRYPHPPTSEQEGPLRQARNILPERLPTGPECPKAAQTAIEEPSPSTGTAPSHNHTVPNQPTSCSDKQMSEDHRSLISTGGGITLGGYSNISRFGIRSVIRGDSNHGVLFSAASTVWVSSVAMVMGPTPPGTGV